MPDWTSSMQQTFEYYVVDPGTWRDVKLLNNIKSCSIQRDSEVATLGSASIDITESIGECYIRVYLVVVQHLPEECLVALIKKLHEIFHSLCSCL